VDIVEGNPVWLGELPNAIGGYISTVREVHVRIDGRHVKIITVRSVYECVPTSAIDPLLIPTSCLPYISVLAVEQNPLQYYIRLTGTAICDAFGYDPTGRYIHEIGGATHPDPRLTWCLENRAHYIVKDDFAWRGDKYKHYHALALPFANRDNNLDRMIIAFWFS